MKNISQCIGICLLAVILNACNNAKIHERNKIEKEKKREACDMSLSLMDKTELQRIKKVWKKKKGDQFNVLKKIVAKANNRVIKPIIYPPNGSVHGQWYQCPKCEYALKTLSPTQHKCKICGKVYSGYPYDETLLKRAHSQNFGYMLDNAKAYIITGDKKYARFVKEILIGYSDRYKKYKLHSNYTPKTGKVAKSGAHIFEQTLDEAFNASTKIAPAYDMVKNSGLFSSKDINKIKNSFILPMLKNIGKYNAGKSNWQTWHNAAMITLGITFNEPKWVKRGIDDPKNGFYYQMENSITKDGFWHEGSMGYHFYALSALIYSAEATKKYKKNLWRSKKLQQMVITPLYYKMPNGTLPSIADSIRSKFKVSSIIAESSWASLKAPELLNIFSTYPTWNSIRFGRNVNNLPSKSSQKLKSSIFKDSGHGILRDYGEKGLTLLFLFTPYKGSHSHFDTLSFIFFGFGKELCVDPGRAKKQAYRLPIHKYWYKGTISHNAVLVDYQSQVGAKSSKLLFSKTGEKCQYIAAESNDSFPGVSHCRLLAMTPEYLLIFDLLNSKQKKTFSLTYHINGKEIVTNKTMQPAEISNIGSGFKYIKNSQKYKVQDNVKVKFIDTNIQTCLTVASKGELDIIIGDGPRESILDRVPLVLISNAKKQKTAFFASIIEPIKNKQSYSVKEITIKKENDTFIITIIKGNNKDIFKFNKKKGLQWELSK